MYYVMQHEIFQMNFIAITYLEYKKYTIVNYVLFIFFYHKVIKIINNTYLYFLFK